MRTLLTRRLPAMLVLTAFTALAADVPRPLANLTFQAPPARGMKPVKLTDYRGKILVIALLSTQCGACAQMAGLLNGIQRDYAAKGVQVVAAAVDPAAINGIGQFIDRNRPRYPIGLLGEDDTRKLADFSESDRPFVPILMFVDKGGTVQQQFFGNSPFMSDANKATRALLENMISTQ